MAQQPFCIPSPGVNWSITSLRVFPWRSVSRKAAELPPPPHQGKPGHRKSVHCSLPWEYENAMLLTVGNVHSEPGLPLPCCGPGGATPSSAVCRPQDQGHWWISHSQWPCYQQCWEEVAWDRLGVRVAWLHSLAARHPTCWLAAPCLLTSSLCWFLGNCLWLPFYFRASE